MHVPSHSPSRSEPLTNVSPATAQAADAAAPQQITDAHLVRAHNMLSTLLRIGVDPIDALVILFDHLNTGAEDSYTAALRHATKNVPPPKEDKTAPPRGQVASARPPQPEASFASRSVLSWPEKVLMCKDGGRHVKLVAGMLAHVSQANEGINRGYRDLPPDCVEYVALPERRFGTPPTRAEFRRWHVDHHMNPAIQGLRPNQVLLMTPPDAPAMLIGMDSAGRRFGFDIKRDSFRDNAPQAHLMSEDDLTYALGVISSCGAHLSNWAIMKPR